MLGDSGQQIMLLGNCVIGRLFSSRMSRFCVDVHDGRRRMRRMPGERYADCYVAEHDRFAGRSVLVCAGICIGGRTDLYVIDRGALISVRYRDEMLHPIVRPFTGSIGDDFILIDDNARPHRAKVVNQYLETETIVRMDWPSRSPDFFSSSWCRGWLPLLLVVLPVLSWLLYFNPIEHACDMLQRAISNRHRLPDTRGKLIQALHEEWQRIPK